jgi:hypothetical protein
MENDGIPTSNWDSENPNQALRNDYESVQALFNIQTPITQRFLETQSRQLAESILKNLSQVHFTLPDKVMVKTSNQESDNFQITVPTELRKQSIGGVFNRIRRSDMRTDLRQRLVELEESDQKAVSVSAQLIRFGTAKFMIYSMLPSGRSVQYSAPEGEEIPSIPTGHLQDTESAITQESDAIAETGDKEKGRGELQVPFVPEARQFFLPQWVAFGQQGNILVKSVEEAENHVTSMQRFLEALHAAVSLAPYFLGDNEYQKKRYGMLGQLVNQGRALAKYQTEEIINVIKRRAASHNLNRGLSLSMPYFDDQELKIRSHNFTIIPAGRIMFVPAFVDRASCEEQAKIAQDTRLSPSTRKYLILQLDLLANAFQLENPDQADK